MPMPAARRRNEPLPHADAEAFFRLMVRTRLFEEFCTRLKKSGEVLGNTYPCLGQEALGVAALALAPGDALFPSYRSRAIVFGKGATVQDHFRELVGAPSAEQAGREVFHHAAFPRLGIMPSSSMIGGWVPTAAGYALTQQFERNGEITLCVAGDGALGAGDLHEALNLVGVWKLPFVLMVENNAWQVSGRWDRMRATRALEPYVRPYGFVTRPVDGNDAFDVFHSMRWARAEALAGRPAMLDCHTFRMGGYSTHFGEPREGIEDELAAWRERDPILLIERHLIAAGTPESEIIRWRAQEREDIEAAWRKVSGTASTS
jgi:TPP-dependent pyruvate/acetoin dehydrogenase alpha subunit